MNRRSFCRRLGLAGLAGLAGCISSTDAPQTADSGVGTSSSPTGANSGSMAAAEAASGEWPTYAVDPQNTGVHPTATGPTEARIAWKAIDDAPTVLCSPTVSGGTVYTGSAAKAIHALDPDTGEEQWRYDTTSYVETAPAVVEGVVYTADADGVVYALGTDGTERWTHETGHNLHSRALAVHEGRVFVGTGGTMPAVASGDTDESRASLAVALDAETGDRLWRYEAPDWFSGPAVGGGRVYVGDHTGRVSALDPVNGDELWTWRPDAPTDDGERPGAVLAPPTYHDGTLYVGVHELGWLVALDAETGTLEWSRTLKAPNVKSSPAVDGDRVYVGATGSESSDYDAPGEVTPTPTPTPTETEGEGPVRMPTVRTSGSVFALSTADGSIDWRYETDHDFRSSPAVVGDRVYVGGGDYLYSLGRSDGEKRWRVDLDDFVYSSPAVVGGRAYVGSAAGHLYCVGGS